MLQVIAERKQYHESTGGRYLKISENNTELTTLDDEEVTRSTYI